VPRTPPPIFPFPGPDRPACSASLFNNCLASWPSSSERAMPHFGRGSSAAAAGRSGVRRGGALAQQRRPSRSWMDTWCTRPTSCVQRMQGLAGFVVDFIQHQSNKLQVILSINAVDSEICQPVCQSLHQQS
jgi:hypothetical protein